MSTKTIKFKKETESCSNKEIKVQGICPKEILECVSIFFSIPSELILSKTRKREIVEPRQVLCYMMKKHIIKSMPINSNKIKSDLSLEEIGFFVGVDHATVLHGIRTVKNLYDTDKNYKIKILQIEKNINEIISKKPNSVVGIEEMIDLIPQNKSWKQENSRQTYIKYASLLMAKHFSKEDVSEILTNLYYASKYE